VPAAATDAVTGEAGASPELVNYWSYLQSTYGVTDAANAEQNKNIIDDRVLNFAEKAAPGGKFKSQRDRMVKALSLPKGTKEELNYPADVAQKIQDGLPLWQEEVRDVDPDAEEDEETIAANQANKLTDDQKNLITMFGEGKFHLIPSFFRALIFLKK